MIATDFLYHLSCKTTYLNRSIPKLAPHTPYDDAFSQLAYKVSNEILEHGTGCYLTQLHDRYVELLVIIGVADATFSKASMKKRIKNPQKGKQSLVCPSCITVGELSVLVTKLQGEIGKCQLESSSDSDHEPLIHQVDTHSYARAKHIHSVIKQKEKDASKANEGETSEQHLQISFEEAANHIPNELYNHLS